MFNDILIEVSRSGLLAEIGLVVLVAAFVQWWRFCSSPRRRLGNAPPGQSDAFKNSMYSESGQAAIFEGTSHISSIDHISHFSDHSTHHGSDLFDSHSSHSFEHSVNIDGSAMCGDVDIHGNTYGTTSHD